MFWLFTAGEGKIKNGEKMGCIKNFSKNVSSRRKSFENGFCTLLQAVCACTFVGVGLEINN